MHESTWLAFQDLAREHAALQSAGAQHQLEAARNPDGSAFPGYLLLASFLDDVEKSAKELRTCLRADYRAEIAALPPQDRQDVLRLARDRRAREGERSRASRESDPPPAAGGEGQPAIDRPPPSAA